MNAIDELKSIPHWVGHKNKIPMNARTGRNAASNDPSTWADVNTAWASVKRHGWDGLGWVFTIGSGIVGIDLDDCFEAGYIKAWARDIVHCLDSYTEFSPSGNGLHIFVRGEIPHSVSQKVPYGLEIYNELRYFTITGKPYGQSENVTKRIEERPDELLAVFALTQDLGEGVACLPKVAKGSYEGKPVTEQQIQDALSRIPIHQDYHDWLRCLMAVHDVFPDQRGVALVEAWSAGYRGEVARKFRSFDRTAKDGVTIGTLFHMAGMGGQVNQNGQQRRKLKTPEQKMSYLMTAEL